MRGYRARLMKSAFELTPPTSTTTRMSPAGRLARSAGTVAASEVSLALVTGPRRSPKRTTISSASEPSAVPAIVTVCPGSALEGTIDVMTGGWGRSAGEPGPGAEGEEPPDADQERAAGPR